MVDLKGYRVIHGQKVLNAVALEGVIYADDFNEENETIVKPKFLGVLAINEDGNIVLIHDEAWRFQFIPALKGGAE